VRKHKLAPVMVEDREATAEPPPPQRRDGEGYPGFFSSARTLSTPIGSQVRPGELGGYYIDFSLKVESPDWPPVWLAGPIEDHRHVVTAQWALGAFERYLRGEGEVWLAAATEPAERLLREQERGGNHHGGWLHTKGMPHTYRLDPPWLSGMAQGEGASLLVRLHAATGDQRFAEGAKRALVPLATPSSRGGVRANLGAGFFLEEYPTDPASLVLNGGIFALWGYYDVAVALDDDDARRQFEEGVDTLAAHIDRWDTGGWSKYDLFPRRVVNVASSAYHVLHINQLRAMQLIAPRPELAAAADRFQGYWQSRPHRVRAFARKALFRSLVPRNRVLAHRTPFGRARPRGSSPGWPTG
jgi:heparosan-N-sulfate-glucuronate 5-epimerase